MPTVKQWFRDRGLTRDNRNSTIIVHSDDPINSTILTDTKMAPAAIVETGWSSDSDASDSQVVDITTQSDIMHSDIMPVKFDPAKHLAFQPPSGTLKMADIGLADNVGVSPIAASEPFQLFSPEAIELMRAEIFNPEVQKKCGFHSNLAKSQLRGYAPKYASFAYEAWNHPATLEIISKIAGVDLVPVVDYEIGHINLSVKSKEQTKEEEQIIKAVKERRASLDSLDDNKPIVGWHRDSYPFVCVLMLSDCTNMVGGETALLSDDGSKVVRVRGPQMVSFFHISWDSTY